jgi:N-acetylneuraminic acid mutarotase
MIQNLCNRTFRPCSSFASVFTLRGCVHLVLRNFVLQVLVLASGAICLNADAQTKEWIWLQGSNTTGKPGVYGTLGQPNPANIPGARQGASSWIDSSGNWWFFGGTGVDSAGTIGYLNDLWKFNASTQQWTWMGGNNTVPKVSGSTLGQPGVYGTLGSPAPGNVPGGRSGASSWVDASGNFWLFGGSGFDSKGSKSALNDLWRFDPASGQWTWEGGSSTATCSQSTTQPCGQPGVYGTQGVAATSNIPGGRSRAGSWIDANGNFWLFGGTGFDSASTNGNLNDLWSFNVSAQQWTWRGGSSTVGQPSGQPGVYGTLGVPSTGNIPGGRAGTSTWIDSSGHLWLFGGTGADSAAEFGALNDLWEFDPSSTAWTWMSGTSTIPNQGRNQGVFGVYGTLGVPAATNVPGSRSDASSWVDSNGHLWLFGGYGFFIPQYFNDIWEFDPSVQEWTWMGGSSSLQTLGVPGTYGTQGVPSPANAPGGRSNANIRIDGTGNLWLFGGFGCGASPSICAEDDLNDLWTLTSQLQITPTVTVTPSQTTITPAQSLSVSITVAGPTGTTTPTGSVTLTGGGFTSSATALNQGSATINIPSGSLSVGTVALTVTYTPDAAASSTYKSASGSTSVIVPTPVPSTYSISATSVTVAPGGIGTSTITINSSNGYAGTVTLSCAVTTTPTAAADLPTCSVSQPVTLSSSAPNGTATATVNTTAPSSSSLARPRGKGWTGVTGEGAVLALLLSFGIPKRQRRWRSMLGAVVLIAVLGTLTGCNAGTGGSGNPPNPGTTAGPYTITLKGMGSDSASTTATASFTVTVN